MHPPYTPTPRTTPRRKRERVGYDRELVHAVLDEAFVCHVGTVVDGRPLVLPNLHVRVGEVLYLHGSTGASAGLAARSAADRGAADRGAADRGGGGLDVCVTVTLVDALVLARSANNHSANYRSVVALGRAHLVTDAAEKGRVLQHLVDHLVPRRSEGVRGPSPSELAATAVLALPLEEVSVKVRTGPPVDQDDDLGLPHWAGLLPLALAAGPYQVADGVPAAAPEPSPHPLQRGR